MVLLEGTYMKPPEIHLSLGGFPFSGMSNFLAEKPSKSLNNKFSFLCSGCIKYNVGQHEESPS